MGEIVRVGDTLAGRYLVEKILGQGGMGVVVGARHIHLDERVAIKMLLPELATHPDVVERFMREARASSKIKSEHVCRVSDVALLDSGAPYMVMEHLDGSDLGAICHQRGALDVGEAVHHILQACDAIAEAHALGIVHRDLKPANLFLTRRRDGSPSVKVLDFGISKDRGSGADHGLTKTTAALGSPNYMSPEQMLSTRDVDGRTDIWALGVTLYQLVTGTVPFIADTLPQICAMVLQTSPRPPRELRAEVPPGLEAIILRCLQKDRAGRFASISELAAALAPFGGNGSVPLSEQIARTTGASHAVSPGASSSGTVQLPSSTLVLATGAPLGQAPSTGTTNPAPTGVTTDGSSSGAVWATSQGPHDRSGTLPAPLPVRRSSGALAIGIIAVIGAAGLVAFISRGMLEPSAPPAIMQSAEPPAAAIAPPVATAPPPEITPAGTASATASASVPPTASPSVPAKNVAPPAASALPPRPPPVKKHNPFED